MLDDQIVAAVKRYAAEDYGAASFAQYAGGELGVEMDASEFRGATFEEAVKLAQDRASQQVNTFVHEVMDENLNPGEDEKDWKWAELTRAVNARYGIQATEKELKQVGRDALDGHLIEQAEAGILATDLSGGQRFLERTYAAESLADWARQKFGLKVGIDEATDKTPAETTALLRTKVREAYRAKDVEFPIQVGAGRVPAGKSGSPAAASRTARSCSSGPSAGSAGRPRCPKRRSAPSRGAR